MSTISPRRTISRASSSVNVLDLDVLVFVLLAPRAPARSAPTRGRRTSPRRSSRASGYIAPSRTTVSGTWPISSWHSRRAACFRRLPLVHAAGRQLPQPLIHRVAVLPDQDHVPRFGHRDDHDRRRMADDVDGDRRGRSAVRTRSRSTSKTLPSKTRSVERRSGIGHVYCRMPQASSSLVRCRRRTACELGRQRRVEFDPPAVARVREARAGTSAGTAVRAASPRAGSSPTRRCTPP